MTPPGRIRSPPDPRQNVVVLRIVDASPRAAQPAPCCGSCRPTPTAPPARQTSSTTTIRAERTSGLQVQIAPTSGRESARPDLKRVGPPSGITGMPGAQQRGSSLFSVSSAPQPCNRAATFPFGSAALGIRARSNQIENHIPRFAPPASCRVAHHHALLNCDERESGKTGGMGQTAPHSGGYPAAPPRLRIPEGLRSTPSSDPPPRYLDFQSPSAAPVGSMMMLNQPASGTSVTSFTRVAPSDWAFLVAAAMSSTCT